MNIYLLIILSVLILHYLLDLVVDILNVRRASGVLPEEFAGFYDSEKYKKSQDYLGENTRFKIIKDTIFTLLILLFILVGGFNLVDRFVRGFHFGPILTGLFFAGILVLILQMLSIPFSVYHTFVIEEKYGFNRTTPKTFILDIVKSLLIGALIGGIIFSGILCFFSWAGTWAWVYCWIAVTLFQLFLVFIAPITILPLFNKFIPLEEGELKSSIESYAKEQSFKLQGIFRIDASRRSSKANAYFTGFGKYRRIALFDTLIDKLNVDELVSVLAHEIGHYKKKHIIKHITMSVVTSGIMFFVLSLFINNKELFSAFKMADLSIYASLFFFSFLYTPISVLLSVLSNYFSRRHEYAADEFAGSTYKKPEAFISALKKLTVSNLSNLTPHSWKVVLYYSHPPILQRIKTIRSRSIFSGQEPVS